MHLHKVTNGTKDVMMDRQIKKSAVKSRFVTQSVVWDLDLVEKIVKNSKKATKKESLIFDYRPKRQWRLVQAVHSSFSIILKEALTIFELHYRCPKKKPKLLLKVAQKNVVALRFQGQQSRTC